MIRRISDVLNISFKEERKIYVRMHCTGPCLEQESMKYVHKNLKKKRLLLSKY